MIVLMLNHLWQSSLCVGGGGLLVLALHRNGANVRFWLWFAASIKFLLPFAALTALSAYLLSPMVRPVAAPAITLIEPLAKPFSAPALALATTRLTAQPTLPTLSPAPELSARPAVPAFLTAHVDLESALLALWAMGFLILAARWATRWARVRALVREATPVQVDAPIVVKLSPSRLEPGLVGVLHPVILLPQSIEQQLSSAELKAVLAHELCHWRRHDNLLAAIHMLVEALFWFFPLVWWLGARLNAERERACDESVLADGNDPQMYAEGILKVCRAYLQSSLACVAGVSGAGLTRRIETIAENRLVLQLNATRKFVLSVSAIAALALPLALGLMAAPATQIQAKEAPNPSPTKYAQSDAEQAPARTPEIFTAALPSNQVAENSVGKRALQTNGAATTSANAATSSPVAPPEPLPNIPPAQAPVEALNDQPVAPTQLVSNDPPVSGAVASNDQTVAALLPPTPQETPASQVQTAASNATATPTTRSLNATSISNVQTAGSQPVAAGVQTANSQPPNDLIALLNVEGRQVADDAPIDGRSRKVCRNLTSVTGVVISPKAIQMRSLVCGNPIGGNAITFGNYLATDEISRDGFRVVRPGRQTDDMVVTMNVNLATPVDAQKMLPGKVVTISGDFSLVTANQVNYLIADHARYLHGDPFGR
jgi:beta-lactamase regulating signal transducer with metallopeptidase domain